MRSQDDISHYIATTFAGEDDLLRQVRAEGERRRPGMQIAPGEGKLLYMQAKMSGAKRILEVGTFMAYSTIWMARALPEDGEVVTIEANDEHAAQAREHIAQSGLNITLLEGRGLEVLETVHGMFDLVFIDADKLNYLNYLEATLPLLHKGGLLIGDNTLLFGHMAGDIRGRASASAIEAMGAFNQRMNDGVQLEGVMIPTEEGLTVARKL
jgi:predicted O-methyltransferase YrrM